MPDDTHTNQQLSGEPTWILVSHSRCDLKRVGPSETNSNSAGATRLWSSSSCLEADDRRMPNSSARN